ncbi:MAG: prolipoprotein diacylglyceryl transferase [Phycisphaerales bacterium]|nr:MAG: prolipoprotein diacylglyceryl transferase [Phycisphaerales bacterium]
MNSSQLGPDADRKQRDARQMYPELFEIPFLHMTAKTYGVMMVIGFLAALWLMKRLSWNLGPDTQPITSAALYCLVAGVAGARLLYVALNFEQFRGRPLAALAVWEGGLVLLGGVISAVAVLLVFLIYHRLSVRRYLDILAIGVMLGVAFGRIGCFLIGDCYGKPTGLPWGVRFPYNSFPYISQINADPARNRPEPHLMLPREDYLGSRGKDGKWYPKPFEQLTERQKIAVTEGKYQCLPVHPTQLYSSAMAAFWCLVLYLFRRRGQRAEDADSPGKLFAKPGCTFALALVVYGLGRFFIEFVRDDNPFALYGLTISQIVSIVMVGLGAILIVVFQSVRTPARES